MPAICHSRLPVPCVPAIQQHWRLPIPDAVYQNRNPRKLKKQDTKGWTSGP
jgi:hypothetical protein